MNKEEIKNYFEIAALGCIDNEQYRQFIRAVNGDEELKKEFGKYQKVASLIPFSLKIEQPPAETKNKVVLGIKKIIMNKVIETKTQVQSTEEKKSEVIEKEPIAEKKEELNELAKEEIINDEVQQPEEIIKENLEEPELEGENFNKNFIEEAINKINYESEDKYPPKVKLNIDYGPVLKEEIVEEVTKKIKKTLSYQFEDFENKISRKNKTTNILLVLITLLLLLLIGWNLYQFFYPIEKRVEIKKEIKLPAVESGDSLVR